MKYLIWISDNKCESSTHVDVSYVSMTLFVNWSLQVSTSHLCLLNIGPELASRPSVMSQIMLVGPAS